MNIEQEMEMFQAIERDLYETFARKRHDYGQTTEETYKKFGPVSLLVRMHDKIGRLDNILYHAYEPQVAAEKAEDTLLDLANYAIIAVMEMRKAKMLETAVMPMKNCFKGCD